MSHYRKVSPTRPVGEEQGQVYVLHFDGPCGHAAHYIGWARNANARIWHHRQGSGARLTQVLRERGITFTVAAIVPGTRWDERRLKNRGSAKRVCPICTGRPLD